MIKLLVGLGNPGNEYTQTRHNVGFWWIDKLAHQHKLDLKVDKAFHGGVARWNHQGQTVWLLEPNTFMNRSGLAVAALSRFYKIAPADILVIHDELDLPPGEVKFKQGGGHAGHNGLRSIHEELGTPDYWRLRVGIGHPGIKSEVVHWVLKKPAPVDFSLIETGIDRSLDALPFVLASNMAQAMKVAHTRVAPRKSASPGQLKPTENGHDPSQTQT
jgi:peptidyl-tRNA hydrolase, PTH1 family